MLIDVSQIPPEGLSVTLPAGEVDLGEPAGLWDGPASVRAAMHLDRSGRGLVIRGTFSGDVWLVCSRCTEPFQFRAEERFDLYCEVDAGTRPGEERELDEDDLDVTYLEEGRINTDHLLRENILLSLPVQPLCRDDCRGLCPQCGANLNLGPCSCPTLREDPRLRVLRKLR
jgi:uncharacterized protein